jgi:SlyX protein
MKKTSGPLTDADIEERLAHQEHAIQALSDELYQQQRQLAALEQLVRDLRARLEPLEQAREPDNPRAEVPPHY